MQHLHRKTPLFIERTGFFSLRNSRADAIQGRKDPVEGQNSSSFLVHLLSPSFILTEGASALWNGHGGPLLTQLRGCVQATYEEGKEWRILFPFRSRCEDNASKAHGIHSFWTRSGLANSELGGRAVGGNTHLKVHDSLFVVMDSSKTRRMQ